MSIVLIRGPESTTSTGAQSLHPVPKQVVSRLVEHAAMAHKTIAMRHCGSETEFLRSLDRVDGAEFLLLDPGACDRSDDLRAGLARLSVPYIEVRDDDFGSLEPALAPACGRPLRVIQGYGAQSYTVALSIALEHLGCAECENNYHVGT